MYGDFSRLTFDESDDYAAVWSQQGRVTLDSDFNELTSIVLSHLRGLTVDTLGPFAAGYPGTAFKVSRHPSDPNDLLIEPGHYYVNGLRCQLPATATFLARSLRSLAGQRAPRQLPERPYLVELVVWEQTITAVTEPSLLEPALGGSDTTVRTAVRFRLEITDVIGEYDVTGEEDRDELVAIFMERNLRRNADAVTLPLLRARSRTDTDPADPGERTRYRPGYRGLENQLYRVQVRTGGPLGAASFVWSRDNASAVFGLRTVGRGEANNEVTAQLTGASSSPPGDLEVGDWVELGDETTTELIDQAPLLQVTGYDRGTRLVTLGAARDFTRNDVGAHPYLRRWDQNDDISRTDNAVPIPAPEPLVGSGSWFELEDGVQVQFVNADSAEFRPGDHWLIPARSALGDILWPRDHTGNALPVRATRPLLFRAPLALCPPDADDPIDLRGSRWRTTVESPSAPARDAEPKAQETGATTRLPTQASAGVAPDTSPPVLMLTVLPPVNKQDPTHTALVGKSIPLSSGALILGRYQTGGDVLTDDSVSKSHARVTIGEQGQMTIQDGTENGPSTNGTRVEHNGQRAEATRPMQVETGDIVLLGAVPLRTERP